MEILLISEYQAKIANNVLNKSSMNLDSIEITSTGQAVIKAPSYFHEKVMIIKSQMSKGHPIKEMIDLFKTKFYHANITLLQK